MASVRHVHDLPGKQGGAPLHGAVSRMQSREGGAPGSSAAAPGQGGRHGYQGAARPRHRSAAQRPPATRCAAGAQRGHPVLWTPQGGGLPAWHASPYPHVSPACGQTQPHAKECLCAWSCLTLQKKGEIQQPQ